MPPDFIDPADLFLILRFVRKEILIFDGVNFYTILELQVLAKRETLESIEHPAPGKIVGPADKIDTRAAREYKLDIRI